MGNTADELRDEVRVWARRLFTRAQLRCHAAVHPHLGGSALQVLSLLALHGTQNAGTLARTAGLSSGGLTTVVDRLERADMVTRRRLSTDRRVVLVALAPDALDRLEVMTDAPITRIERLLQRRSAEELIVLARFLHDLCRTP